MEGPALPGADRALLGHRGSGAVEELRRQAEDELADVRLALGEHDRLVGDLEAAVASEPLRERRWPS